MLGVSVDRVAAGDSIRVEPSAVRSWRDLRKTDPQSRSRLVSPDSREFAAADITLSFPAIGDDDTRVPADASGAVGPSHVMTMLNSEVRVQTRDGSVVETVSLSSFWTAATGLVGDPFDPRLQYDSAAARWIATVAANARSDSSAVWFAISEDADPTGNWTFYAFAADAAGELWADFPGFGSSAKWIAITNNMLAIAAPPPPGIAFKGARMWAIGKSSALAGGALEVTAFDPGFAHVPVGCAPLSIGCEVWSFSMMPSAAPDDPGKLYLIDNSGFSLDSLHLIRVSEIDGSEAAPSWSPVADAAGPDPGTGFFSVIDDFEAGLLDAEQSGSPVRVDSGDFRVSSNAVTQNGKVWFAHAGGLPLDAVDRTAVFWYEIDPSLLDSSGAPIVQHGVVDGGAGVHHLYPSIAVNGKNDACLGFSRSSAATFLEGVVTGREAGDPPGAMGPLQVVKAGEAAYLKEDEDGAARWGRYSATVVDPADALSFWTLQQYAADDAGPGPADDRWGTWWAYKRIDAMTTTSTITTTSTSTTTSVSTTTTTIPGGVCGDPVPDRPTSRGAAGLVTASDALYLLRAAVGSASCELCVCDVDQSGAVTASDALTVLQRAVGVEVTLSCPPCEALRG